MDVFFFQNFNCVTHILVLSHLLTLVTHIYDTGLGVRLWSAKNHESFSTYEHAQLPHGRVGPAPKNTPSFHQTQRLYS
jgi:hypothetical protein